MLRLLCCLWIALRAAPLTVTEVAPGIAAGLPMQQVVRDAAASERTKWQRFDSANLRNAEQLYPAFEWE
jgi:hypothetical protein